MRNLKKGINPDTNKEFIIFERYYHKDTSTHFRKVESYQTRFGAVKAKEPKQLIFEKSKIFNALINWSKIKKTDSWYVLCVEFEKANSVEKKLELYNKYIKPRLKPNHNYDGLLSEMQ